MKPGPYTLRIHQGAKLDLPLSWKNSSGTIVDLNGYTARLQVRDEVDSAAALIDLTTENGGITITPGAVDNHIRLNMNATATAALDFDDAVYDLELYPAGATANAVRLLQGRAVLSREVTR